MVSLIGVKSCHSCEFKLHMPNTPREALFCRRYPPTLMTSVIQTPQGPQVATNGSYAPVNPEYPCGEYKRNEAYARDELTEASREATKQ